MHSKQGDAMPLPNLCFHRGLLCCRAGVAPLCPPAEPGPGCAGGFGRGFPQQDPHAPDTAPAQPGEPTGQMACKANVKCTEKSWCQAASNLPGHGGGHACDAGCCGVLGGSARSTCWGGPSPRAAGVKLLLLSSAGPTRLVCRSSRSCCPHAASPRLKAERPSSAPAQSS